MPLVSVLIDDMMGAKNQKFENMGIFCALCVVFVHSGGGGGRLNQFVCQLIGWGFCSIAVPYYFFASGYFLGKHVGEENWYGRAIGTRMRTLVLPFIFWNMAYLVYMTMARVLTINFGTLIRAFGLDFFAQPLLYPLWYLRSLIIMVLISPLIVCLVDKFRRWYFFALAPVYLFFCGVCDRYADLPFLFYSPFSLAGYFYFGLGIYVRQYGCDLTRLRQHKVLIAIVGLLIPTLGRVAWLMGYRSVADCAWVMGIPPLMFTVWEWVKNLQLPEVLRKASFTVFVLHVFVLYGLHRFTALKGDCCIGYLLSGIITFIICVVVDVVFRRVAPYWWLIIMGGR